MMPGWLTWRQACMNAEFWKGELRLASYGAEIAILNFCLHGTEYLRQPASLGYLWFVEPTIALLDSNIYYLKGLPIKIPSG